MANALPQRQADDDGCFCLSCVPVKGG